MTNEATAMQNETVTEMLEKREIKPALGKPITPTRQFVDAGGREANVVHLLSDAAAAIRKAAEHRVDQAQADLDRAKNDLKREIERAESILQLSKMIQRVVGG